MGERISARINRQGFSLRHHIDTVYHTFDFHAHEEYEIFYFQKGEVWYYLEGNAYSLVPGDVLVIPPSVMHRAVIVDENAVYQRYILMLSEEYCRKLLKDVDSLFTRKEMPPMHISLRGEEQEELRRKLDKLMSLANDPAGRLAGDSLCTLLLLQFQEYADTQPASDEPRPQQAQEIVRYINAHFTQDISLEDIAKHFFISKNHLIRQFKQYTRTTVHKYITAKRILLAKALLKENVPVTEVAEACGFASYTSFYQAFLRHTGQSPSQYMDDQG